MTITRGLNANNVGCCLERMTVSKSVQTTEHIISVLANCERPVEIRSYIITIITPEEGGGRGFDTPGRLFVIPFSDVLPFEIVFLLPSPMDCRCLYEWEG